MVSPRPSRQTVCIAVLLSRPMLDLKIILLEAFKPTGYLSLGFFKGSQPS